MKAPPRKAPRVRRFVRRAGAPFTAEDTDVIGAELVRLAEAAEVNDVASLDPREVLDAAIADKKSPLRRVYGNFENVQEAAREHWVEVTRQMLQSVHVVYTNMPKNAPAIPLVVYCNAPRRAENGGVSSMKRRTLSDDMLKHDAQFMSALKHKIELLQGASAGLTWVCCCSRNRKPPKEIARLQTEVESALMRYFASVREANIAAE